MIDVVIYSDEMNEEIGLNQTSTAVREALEELGYEYIGLVSIRNKEHYEDEYNKMVVNH